MSRGFYINLKRQDQRDLPTDPRFPIAQHIGWVRPTHNETEYFVPEPDNYNRAVMAPKPLECPFIEDQVFYRDLERNAWWSIYYVPQHLANRYDLWINNQTVIYRWWQPNPAAMRQRRPLLYNRINSHEMTTNERLYTMGYYANLHSKYFSDDDTILFSRLGSARANLLENLPE